MKGEIYQPEDLKKDAEGARKELPMEPIAHGLKMPAEPVGQPCWGGEIGIVGWFGYQWPVRFSLCSFQISIARGGNFLVSIKVMENNQSRDAESWNASESV